MLCDRTVRVEGQVLEMLECLSDIDWICTWISPLCFRLRLLRFQGTCPVHYICKRPRERASRHARTSFPLVKLLNMLNCRHIAIRNFTNQENMRQFDGFTRNVGSYNVALKQLLFKLCRTVWMPAMICMRMKR